MKIGLITYHGAHNYGSVLQAYALYTVLSGLGHSVEIINYRPDAQRALYPVMTVRGRGIKRVPHGVFQLSHYHMLRRRYFGFEQFLADTFATTPLYRHEVELDGLWDRFDTLVCGSDQIWNPECPDFSSAYFLDFGAPQTRRISYAASFGRGDFDQTTKELIRGLLPNLDRISVRESSGVQLINELAGIRVDHVCDPVMLLDESDWRSFAKPPLYQRPYILTYMLENNHGSLRHLDEVRHHTGHRVVSLTPDIRNAFKFHHRAYGATPREFVGLFSNAAFVLTNSFHGMMFSLILGVPFMVATGQRGVRANASNDMRKFDLLRVLELESRALADGDSFHEDLLVPAPTITREKISAMQHESLRFLINALS